MRLIATFLIIVGRPIYFLLRFLLIHPIKIRKSTKPAILYQASPKRLKNFLKTIYPFVRLLSKVQPPKLPLFRFKIYWRFLQLLLLAGTVLGLYAFIIKDLPQVSSLSTDTPPLTTHILDRHGVELYKIYYDQNRTLISLDEIPLTLRQATIAIEDAEFYKHPGFSVKGILRAISRNWEAGRTVEGGSTITQQLVKTALLSPEQSIRRKLRELVLSLAVETRYSKDQILELYLNRVGYGGVAYGVEEAAQTYFGKSSSELNLAESALLAGLPASPTIYSPFGARPELAKERQKEVLRRMVSEGFITWDQAQEASLTELKFAPQATNIQAPHFVMYVKDLLATRYDTSVVEQGGLTVITSLDLSLQKTVQQIVANEVNQVRYLNITNGAALVTNPQTGEILAMVGSVDYFDQKNDGNVNVTLRPRQPGSAIKPVNYALAFANGFTPASIIDDSPVIYRTPGQPDYSPVNYDGRFHGRIPLRTALASSYNIPAVKLLAVNGVTEMINLGQKMGITTWKDTGRFGLSLTLGGGEVTMADMAVVYGTFANSGIKIGLQPILEIRDSNGNVLEKLENPEGQRVLDPRIAFMITDILSDNQARTPAFGPNSNLYLPNVAVKTGTTNNLRDNWTIGYTSDRVVSTWVGNNDNSPMSYVASGITGASPIWRKIFNELVKSNPPTAFTPPANLVQANICPLTGELACPGCPAKTEYFLPGTEPKISCSQESIRRYFDSLQSNEDRDRILTGESVGL